MSVSVDQYSLKSEYYYEGSCHISTASQLSNLMMGSADQLSMTTVF